MVEARNINPNKVYSNHIIQRAIIILVKNKLHDPILIIVKISNEDLHQYKVDRYR